MAKLKPGVPYWFERLPVRRRPDHPRLRGHLEAEVAVVGGGLTGCTIAWTFAAAGVDVVLLEAHRVGQGPGTTRSLGLLRQEPDADFQEIAAAYGLRAARRIWQDVRRASLEFAAALRRLRVRCDLETSDAIWFTRSSDNRRLRRELKARRDAGVTQDGSSWLTAAQLRRETAIEGNGGLKTRGVSQLDPFRACLGLAAAATAKGALVHERSPVVRIRVARKGVDLRTAGGTVHADRVIIATGYPPDDLRSLRRHFTRLHSYIVQTESLPAAMRRAVGRRTAVLRDAEQPPHFLRWTRSDRIMFSGGDQPAVADRSRPKVLVQRTGQLMYELSTHYPAISGIPPVSGWDVAYSQTRDGLPYIGPHRNFPRLLFALGHGRHGAGLCYLAARILLRAHQESPDRGDELFAFTRTL